MKLFQAPKPTVAIRGMHLDLKGLPPSPQRFLEIPDLLAAAHLNCVLVEWEDTYPWTCYPELRCPTAYSEATVRRFLKRAAALGIQVVPLVQCFGHMENVLGKRRFREMREDPMSVGELCPCHPRAVEVVAAMVDDVLRTHQGVSTYFHLGGDEVWNLGSCPKCKQFVEAHGKAALYLKQVEPLLQRLNAAGLKPILWDDMMREWPAAALKKLGRQTALMPWTYGPKPFDRIKPDTFARFRAAGIELWGAGAFKGADGLSADVCSIPNRTANMLEWSGAARKLGLAGIVATGWSRYATYTIPCEGLESALDALLLAGAAMWDGKLPEDALAQAEKLLQTAPLKALAGEQFTRCRETSRQLQDWYKRLPGLLEHLRRPAHAAGEAERLHPAYRRDSRRAWRKYLKQGEELTRAWSRAHAGRVPALWRQRYAASRTWLAYALDTGLAGL